MLDLMGELADQQLNRVHSLTYESYIYFNINQLP